jgi:protein-tyrosine phosphatase
MQKILFVCTGNICRSPTAEGVLRHRIEAHNLHGEITVDSAGTHGYHIGEAPDVRSVSAARNRGIQIGALRARKVAPSDFHDFDLILGLDASHVRVLEQMAPKDARAKIALFLEFAGNRSEQEVPDPYYGGSHDFEYVLDLIEAGADAMLKKIHPSSETH